MAESKQESFQGILEINELLTEIAEGRGPFKHDNYEFANSVIENSKANAKKVIALLKDLTLLYTRLVELRDAMSEQAHEMESPYFAKTPEEPDWDYVAKAKVQP